MERDTSTPLKLLIRDLKRAVRCKDSDNWELQFLHVDDGKEYSKTIRFTLVWIQGTIEQDTADDVLIVNDNTGRVKLTKSEQTVEPLDQNWMSSTPKPYCCLLGQLVDVRDIPEILVFNLTPVTDDLSSRDVYESMWPLEVEELKRVLVNAVRPILRK